MSLPAARTSIGAMVVGYLSTLRLPVLFALTAAVFLLDLVVPDFVPFVDEIMLGLATAFLGSWKQRKDDSRGEDDVVPDA